LRLPFDQAGRRPNFSDKEKDEASVLNCFSGHAGCLHSPHSLLPDFEGFFFLAAAF
jgi:hypothetical protein